MNKLIPGSRLLLEKLIVTHLFIVLNVMKEER